VIGEKCDRCEPGYWRMTSEGCQRTYVVAGQARAQPVRRQQQCVHGEGAGQTTAHSYFISVHVPAVCLCDCSLCLSVYLSVCLSGCLYWCLMRGSGWKKNLIGSSLSGVMILYY